MMAEFLSRAGYHDEANKIAVPGEMQRRKMITMAT